MVRGCRSVSGITPTEQRLAFTLVSFLDITPQTWRAAHAGLPKCLRNRL
ncbi:hypothetical protein CBM2587_A160071 [Cupriavidus taiwanensis]|uniref:Transposase n=1 Tax=Cupriavidus taiwanensis TaxID=164546 RepID=A0A975ZYN4_9BURK|nr:hypothetical protein CBM2587_A160071 [Cupriavidus taiwanensis]